jgi:hypothetical protein
MTIPNLPEFFRIFRKNRFYTASLARGKERAKWALAQLHVKTGAKAQEIDYEEDP